LELPAIPRRQSTPVTPFPRRVQPNFSEFYGADLPAGSTWEQWTGWVWGLLFRPLSRVPRDVRLAWVALWIATLAVVALAVLAAIPADSWRKIHADWLAEWHWLLFRRCRLRGVAAQDRHGNLRTRRPLHEGRSRQHRRAAGGPRARPQTLGCAARGHPLQAHHHRLAQPRHHARPRSSELFLGATRGAAKNCRDLARICRVVRAGTRQIRAR